MEGVNIAMSILVFLLVFALIPLLYVSALIVTRFVIIEHAIRFSGALAALIGCLLVYAGAAGCLCTCRAHHECT